ncbi:MAG: decaprenyl-phosphate phosphoribosyltransferase [Chloroflexota bacterium]|nr:MAG: decaprenyl-phosphate phosphoribosyltransferase [Chloroflexota bacterium]
MGRAATWRSLLVTARPRQWTKNAIIYLALFFSINLSWRPSDPSELVDKLATVSLAFVIFCLLSSVVYVLNDLVDLEKDRQHPIKRFRPLAAGTLRPRTAILTAVLALIVCVLISLQLHPLFGVIGAAYLLMQVAYSFWLKHMVLIDVFVIASGFVMRAVAGAVVIGVPISPWLYVCTALGALFLGFSKRRQELVLLSGNASRHRRILEEYSPKLLDEIIAVITSSTVMAYSLYTFSADNLPRNHVMMLTIPFVLYGVFRYLYLVHQKNAGGSPEEVLLRDRPLLCDIVLWLATSVAILIVFRP